MSVGNSTPPRDPSPAGTVPPTEPPSPSECPSPPCSPRSPHGLASSTTTAPPPTAASASADSSNPPTGLEGVPIPLVNDSPASPAPNATPLDIDASPPDADQTPVSDAGASPPPVEEELKMTFKWSGNTYDMSMSSSDLVFDLRSQIESLTAVPSAAQKILGLTRGKLGTDSDSTRLGVLGIKNPARFTLVGTPEHLRFKEREGPPPPDDFDIAYPSARGMGLQSALIPPAQDPRNLRKVQQIIQNRPITIMNEPRPGTRLLVLDLDYTIADTRPLLDGALPPPECARPGLHAFLERVYPHYDIVVWSQTHWMWLESKLVELGVLDAEAPYKISFVADRTTMFPIFSERGGQMVKHEVKPLAYFWAKFAQWSANNTVHIDDLARNFALNPGEGLKIRAFKGAGTESGLRDRELEKLGDYLTEIAENVTDFTTLDHAQWKKRRRSTQ